MTYTVWSNAGKHEWIIRIGENIVARSGLVFNSRSAAVKDLNKAVKKWPSTESK